MTGNRDQIEARGATGKTGGLFTVFAIAVSTSETDEYYCSSVELFTLNSGKHQRK